MFRVSIAGTVAAGLLVAPWCTGAVAQNAPSATTPTPKVADTKKPASSGLAAARERQKNCGAEWKEAKAAGKVEKGMTWPEMLECLRQAADLHSTASASKLTLKAEGVGESLCLADALRCHPEPGRRASTASRWHQTWPPPARMTQSSALRRAKIETWRQN